MVTEKDVDRGIIVRARRLKRRLLDELPDALNISRVLSSNEHYRCSRFVEGGYLERGYLPEGSSLDRRWDDSSLMTTFYINDGPRIVAVSGIIEDSPSLGLPADSNFGDELSYLRSLGSVCEFTRQLVHPDYRYKGIRDDGRDEITCNDGEIILNLMRRQLFEAYRKNIRFIGIQVSPSHLGFYGINMFRQMGVETRDKQNPNDVRVFAALDLLGLEERCVAEDLRRYKLGGEKAVYLHDFYFKGNKLRWQTMLEDASEIPSLSPPPSEEWIDFISSVDNVSDSAERIVA